MADATVTLNTINIKKIPVDGVDFYASAYSADWSTVGEIVAAVTGSSHYITKIIVRTATAMTISIGSGTGSDAVTTLHLGPIAVNAASGIFAWRATDGYGMKLTLSTEMALETSASGALWVYVEGKTCLG
jgi:hypothetical protein